MPEGMLREGTTEDRLKRALSITAEALNNMSCVRYEDIRARQALFADTIRIVKEIIGPENTITTMKVVCAWCKVDIGHIEGNGCREETHGICLECKETALKDELNNVYNVGGTP